MGKKWESFKKEMEIGFKQGIIPAAIIRHKKKIKKQQRSESRMAQRTGNKYMIGKKTTYPGKSSYKPPAKARPKGGWKAED